jgi:hypothetical protein
MASASCRRGEAGYGPDLALALLDVSEWGAGLAVRQPLQEGEEVALVLVGPAHLRLVAVTASIAWCEAGDDESCRVGVQFHRRLPWEDLLSLV